MNLFGNKIAFHTLGCKLNFAESSSIARSMQAVGYDTVPFDETPDVYVINTCSVTDNADRKCRSIVRKALRTNPSAFVVVMGCYAQLKPSEISSIKGVDLVLGAAEKFRLPDILAEIRQSNDAKRKSNECGLVMATGIENANTFVDAFSIGDRTRSFLKIQDGCDYNCSFCTIPMARGRSRSDSLGNIMRNARKIADGGVKEIVLTGVNIGDYGKGADDNSGFLDVITALDGLEGVERIRISSIEPNLLRNSVIDFVSQSRLFMPHFHIPLQSGSNKVLGLMRRRYRRELYADRVAKINSVLPHACIGADVIVGFPGETDEDFLDTYRFLSGLDISYLHVFTFSERPGTRAVELPGSVPSEVRKERSLQLRTLSERKRRHFYERFIGSARSVLFESENKDGFMEGFTDNYIRIAYPYSPGLCGTIADMRLERIDGEGNVEAAIAAGAPAGIPGLIQPPVY